MGEGVAVPYQLICLRLHLVYKQFCCMFIEFQALQILKPIWRLSFRMARTRIDPWQAEEELPWRPLSHPSKINSGPKPLSMTVPYTFQNVMHKEFQRPKQPETLLRAYSRSLPTCTSPPWAYRPKTNSLPLSSITSNNSSTGNEFEVAANKVLAALNMAGEGMNKSSRNSVNVKRKRLELPDGDKRKHMIPKVVLRDIGALISKVCPKLVHSPNKEDSVIQHQDDPESLSRVVSTQKSPTPPCWNSSQDDVPLASRLRPQISTVPVTPPRCIPVVTKTLVTLDPPIITIDPPVVTIPDTPDIVIPKSLISKLPIMSPVSISKSISQALKPPVPSSKTSPKNSEKSPTPVSFKSDMCNDLFETLATLPPSPNSQKSPSSTVPVACYPMETASSSFNPVPFHDKTVVQVTSMSETAGKATKPKTATTSHVAKPNRSVKNGFPGFPEEDPKRLKKTRFHVNTNILASSLDLLDLHKHAGMPSGSPSNCKHCNIIFSSVKHCKYHQSVSSMDIFSDPNKQQNIKEDGVWLCPWCPIVCGSINHLNAHRQECREKGRCSQVQKDSSLRKNASNSSRRKTCFSASNSLIPSYNFLPGHVIPV